MRFIPTGPEVPERLIRAHEDGQVVFFCGAGISYPAGLQSFTWLVDELYGRLHRTRRGPEELAYSDKRYDAVLTLLERDIAGGRQTVRTHLPEILKPDLRKKNALATHRALLTLARDRDDRTRLVTTNFDRLFVRAEKKIGHISAPHLPTPKQSRWNGVVYLHGLIDDAPTETNLNRLVLTSGDFGLAYLTERWASRFVSELFARYTVCFVGYSADDVVLRYMLDALSADELLGEKPIEVFSFAGAEQGKEETALESWRAKGVTPIIYDSGKDHSHSNLHGTLRSWAKTYRDGLQGRRGVALREARLSPDKLDASGSTARLIWALNEPTGEIAKAFATVEPPPTIDWLAAFTDYRFGHSDLPHFGIECSQIPERHPNQENGLKYSLLHHPSAPSYAQWTNLVVRDGGLSALGGLDPVSVGLAHWLCRHLDKSETILWVAKNGGRLHPRFEDLVRSALRNAELSDAHRRIWEVIVAGYAISHENSTEFYGWEMQLPTGPIGASSRLMFYKLLEPRVSFSEPFRLQEDDVRPPPARREPRVNDIVRWSLTLEGGHPFEILGQLRSRDDWPALLVESLPVFTQLLKSSVDLMVLLDGASPEEDLSVWHQPSIAPHSQNRHFNAWTALVELCRDAWTATAKVDSALALAEFERWRSIDYMVFRRLVMYCAATSRLVSPATALELLIEKNSLWSENCKHEAIQLLVHLAPKLSATDAERILKRIAKGPARRLYRKNLSREEWRYVRERTIWVRLTKWRESKAKMPKTYQALLGSLDKAHPEWLAESSERLEFRSWMSSGTGDFRSVAKLPRDVSELTQALTDRKDSFFETDDWSTVCSEEPSLARSALQQLIQMDAWPAGVWRDALNAPAQGADAVVTVATFGRQIAAAPDSFFVDTQQSLPWWLRQQSETVAEQDAESFFEICRRVLDALKAEPLEATDDVVGQAINHAVGRTVEALINYWYRTKPQPGQGLIAPYREILDVVCAGQAGAYLPGLVIAAANLLSLFIADAEWTRRLLLPKFDVAQSPDVAFACWEGFLWVPRIDVQLFQEMSPYFAPVAKQYDRLGKHQSQFASLIVWTAMELADEQKVQSIAAILNDLPPPGLAAAAQTLVQTIAGRGDTLSDYLTNRVRRVYPSRWPSSSRGRSVDEGRAIALFCVGTGDQFETWVKESRPFLAKFPDIYLVAHQLFESGLCAKYPDAALDLLFHVVPDEPYPTEELSKCLTTIEAVRPKLAKQKRFQRLREIARKYGF